MSDETAKKASGTLLILGGTAEAQALAGAAAERFGARLRIVTSFAGLTQRPRVPAGEIRRGGFGGAEGLSAYLQSEDVRFVIDALHPFAAVMARHAVEACVAAGVPRLALRRAPWIVQPGDHWIEVADAEHAARALIEQRVRRVFFASGIKDVAAFAGLPDIWFLVRLAEPREETLPLERYGLIYARGPFDAAQDEALLKRHAIEAVICKNAGGAASYAKIAAARALGLPVVMIAAPKPPPGECALDVATALCWLDRHL
ncbi:MAG TPA: cobalt-precorrin-6A reductase [Alphaproteobacteria bacterium]|nr:cobalt-precorrin-6A reductase [Alphaproteobacteria bacterium]